MTKNKSLYDVYNNFLVVTNQHSMIDTIFKGAMTMTKKTLIKVQLQYSPFLSL